MAATNKKFSVAHIVPSKIDKAQTGNIVSFFKENLGLKEDFIRSTINSGSDYARILPGRLTAEQVNLIKEKAFPGVDISYVTDRYYPQEQLGADILGFLGYSEEGRSGQYGIESFYNQELFGQGEQSNRILGSGLLGIIGSLWPGAQAREKQQDSTFDRPKDIVLTIDKNIQEFAEGKLEQVMKQWQAVGGSIIVQDPMTGKILAMADRPVFDPNAYTESKTELYLNSNVQQIFEPGSSFKPITMAAGLDKVKITPQTTYEDKGFVQVAEYTIRNFSEKVFGRQTMSQVLEKSINTGTMFVENLVGDDAFLDYVLNFGFGQRTGIDLPGEVNGDISNLYSGRKINFLTASFGQGIAVTPLQLINAYSAIANGGKLMKPYIVDRVITEGKEVVTQPEMLGIPISEKTSAKLKTMLVSVVDNGFDKARIKGYEIAGKTGTAQIPDAEGGYLKDEYIHNFLGFAPANDPRFTVLIKIDKPKGITFASDSLSPTYREITAFLLNYYNIPPTR
ncbi:MAG: penicillin-binding protein 2 [Candidatus Yanofskybacteria bacterium]|nr:penicillin-binding protein 2 [Candidatus Yanofskybacteria bacterium]